MRNQSGCCIRDVSSRLCTVLVLPALLALAACHGGRGGEAQEAVVDLRPSRLGSPIAHISSQCFTKTTDASGKVHNPCFSCHIPSQEPNYVDDGDLQLEYSFPGDPGEEIKNPWVNLF